MAITKKHDHLDELATTGAHVKVSHFRRYLTLLTSMFPHLRDSVDRDELPVGFILKKGRDRAEAGRNAAKK
jgi:hypothetical protein